MTDKDRQEQAWRRYQWVDRHSHSSEERWAAKYEYARARADRGIRCEIHPDAEERARLSDPEGERRFLEDPNVGPITKKFVAERMKNGVFGYTDEEVAQIEFARTRCPYCIAWVNRLAEREESASVLVAPRPVAYR